MKSDKGFDESEKLLNQLESDIHKEYAQATKEMGEKVEKYFAKFRAEDEKQRELYEQGKITKKEYGEWRQRKMLTGKQYTDMRDTLAKDLTNADKIAMSYARDKAIDTYALNMNYETYNIENDLKVDTSFSLYNHDSVKRLIKDKPDLLPQPEVDIDKDLRWNMQHLQSALIQGILQGESIPKIAARMQRVAAMDDRAAIRNARTAMTGAQNGGRLDAMERAKERGVDVKKAWMATLDDRTRDSHVELDGEEQEIDEEFTNHLMFPGDPEGEPAEVYNCRCRMVHVYGKYPVDWSDTDLRNTDNLGDMTYEEWKEAHESKKESEETSDTKSFNVTIDDGFSAKAKQTIEDITSKLVDEYDTPLESIKVGSTKGTRGAEGGHVSTGVRQDMYIAIPKPEVIIHEFAHTIAIQTEDKVGLADNKEFWKEIRKVRTAYQKDSSINQEKIISVYASTDIDEFMAEAFALVKSNEMGYGIPDGFREGGLEWAEKVVEIVDKYFRR